MTFNSDEAFRHFLRDFVLIGGAAGFAFSFLISPVFLTFMAGNVIDQWFKEWKTLRDARTAVELEKIRREIEESRNLTEEARRAKDEIQRLSKLD